MIAQADSATVNRADSITIQLVDVDLRHAVQALARYLDRPVVFGQLNLESLPVAAQVKLLRVLESGEVRRLGEAEKRPVDFRVLATAKEDLRTRIKWGVFRLDLYQRVAGMVIELPRLTDRGDDIVLLAEHFASNHGRVLQPGTESVLDHYDWPGNVRELRAAVDRAFFLSNGCGISPSALAEAIALGTLPEHDCPAVHATRPHEGNGDCDRRRLLTELESNGWHGGRTAAALGMGRSTLFRKLRTVGISLHDARRESQESR